MTYFDAKKNHFIISQKNKKTTFTITSLKLLRNFKGYLKNITSKGQHAVLRALTWKKISCGRPEVSVPLVWKRWQLGNPTLRHVVF